MSTTNHHEQDRLPEVIRRYQQARDRHDTDTALATFAANATVIDEGHEHHGSAEIRKWLSTAAREFTFTSTLLSAETVDHDDWLVVNRLEGDFPGNVVDLRFQFRLSGPFISQLTIAP